MLPGLPRGRLHHCQREGKGNEKALGSFDGRSGSGAHHFSSHSTGPFPTAREAGRCGPAVGPASAIRTLSFPAWVCSVPWTGLSA